MHGQTAVKLSNMGQHRTVLPTTILGKVTKVGYYRDTLPLFIITIRKEDAASLPYKTGERVSLPLVINGKHYSAGLRATANSNTVMICSDLTDSNLSTVRLVDLLFGQGWTNRDAKIMLTVKNEIIYFFEMNQA